MTGWLDEFETFARALTISSAGLVWLRSTGLHATTPGAPWPGTSGPLESTLAALVYWRFYGHPHGDARATATGPLDYAAAYPEPYAPDPGWAVLEVARSGLVVTKGHRRRRIAHEGVADGPAQPGAVVSLARKTHSTTHQPGFFHLFGRALAGDFDREHVVRFYLDTGPDEAVCNCAVVGTRLNRLDVPFLVKSLIDPAAFARSDSCVLYVPRRCFGYVAQELVLLGLTLRDRVPRLTLPLCAGIGCAEDPPGGVSFGQHRSAVLARALLDCSHGASGHGLFDATRRAFSRAGLDWSRPWLNPGSADLVWWADDVHGA